MGRRDAQGEGRLGGAVINATEGDAELKGAEDAAGARLAGERRYRFHVYRPGPESRHPSDLKSVLVELKEQAVAFSDGRQVLFRRDNGSWQLDSSMPTS